MKNLVPYFILEQFKRGCMNGQFQAIGMFVDLSGFTPLTETLMQHRQDGAEALNDALESIFAPLVNEVVARGGIIPLYAGDAFAALFPCEPASSSDTLLHVLKVGVHIQQLFSDSPGERQFFTKYGRFTMGVKVGLSFGEVEWGIPGRDNCFSFYFRGPGMQACVEAEDHADRGEIIADDSLMELINEQDVVAAVPTGDPRYYKLKVEPFDLPELGVRHPPLLKDDLLPFAPSVIIELPVRAEFRNICPVFISFEEPADRHLLLQFVNAALDLGQDYGGQLSQVDFSQHGALLVFWFGAPVSYENNSERAAEFLLAFQKQHWPIRWRAGVTQGMVFAGIRGGVERCEYAAIGDVVNMACRLATRAEWNQVWMGSQMRESLGPQYQVEEVGTFQFKGKSDLVPAFQLCGRKEASGSDLHRGEMIGRQRELTRLEEFIAPLFENQFAGLAAVYGDAGMGKSRLIFELRQRLSAPEFSGNSSASSRNGHNLHWLICPTDGILRQSLNPFKHMLRRYFGQSADYSAPQNRARFEQILDSLVVKLQSTDTNLAEQASEISGELQRTHSFLAAMVDLYWEGSLYEELEPQLRFDNTLAAFKTLVQAESLCRPVVVCVEDLHWLDADSREMLTQLTRNMEPYPVGLICTSRYRDDGTRLSLGLESGVVRQVIDLATLESADAQHFAGSLLSGNITSDLAEFLHEKTGGNPFFVEQLVLDLRERDLLDRTRTGTWALSSAAEAEVPPTISAVLIARLDRLIAEVRQVVQAAAVLGREFHIQVLSQMLQDDSQVELRVRQAEVERIWQAVNGVRYLFRHALMRDAAYEMQMRSRLRELHALAVDAIERVYLADLAPHYPDLAYHSFHAGDLERERVYACLAGFQAAERFANAEAVTYLQRALDLTPERDLMEQFQLVSARERIFSLMGDRVAQARDLRALSKLAEALGVTQLIAQVVLRQAIFADLTGDYQAAVAAIEAAVELSREGGDHHGEAAALRKWGEILWHQGEFLAAQERLEQGLALARQRKLLRVEADCLLHLAPAVWLQGNLDESDRYHQQALALYRRLGNRRREAESLLGLVYGHRTRDQYAEALAISQESLGIYRELGDRQGEAQALRSVAAVFQAQGDLAKGGDYFQLALYIFWEIGDMRGQVMVLDSLSGLYYQLGDFIAARDYALRALHIVQSLGARYLEGYVNSKLGFALKDLGELDEAVEAFQKSLAIRRQGGNPGLLTEPLTGLASIALRKGDFPLALRRVEEVLEILEAYPKPGVDDLHMINLICYQVLAACEDPRALKILEIAYRQLEATTEQLEDERMIHKFLEIPSANREIVREWKRIQTALN